MKARLPRTIRTAGLAVVLLFSFPALATIHTRAQVCQILLWQTREYGHSIESISSQRTAQAIEVLQAFRNDVLNIQKPPRPNQAAVETTSADLEHIESRNISTLAARIAGIEWHYLDISNKNPVRVFASLISGQQEYSRWNESVLKNISLVTNADATLYSLKRNKEAWNSFVSAAGATSIVAGYGAWTALSGAFNPDELKILIPAGALVGSTLYQWARYRTEPLEYINRAWNDDKSSFENFVFNQHKPSPKSWVYYSRNDVLPQDVVESILIGGHTQRELFEAYLGPGGFERYAEDWTNAGPLFRFWAALRQPRYLSESHKLIHVLSDILIYFDDHGTPHLVTVLRVANRKPEFRSRKRRTSSQSEPQVRELQSLIGG